MTLLAYAKSMEFEGTYYYKESEWRYIPPNLAGTVDVAASPPFVEL